MKTSNKAKRAVIDGNRPLHLWTRIAILSEFKRKLPQYYKEALSNPYLGDLRLWCLVPTLESHRWVYSHEYSHRRDSVNTGCMLRHYRFSIPCALKVLGHENKAKVWIQTHNGKQY